MSSQWGEVEITPEMIARGSQALIESGALSEGWDYKASIRSADGSDDVAELVHTIMRAALLGN